MLNIDTPMACCLDLNLLELCIDWARALRLQLDCSSYRILVFSAREATMFWRSETNLRVKKLYSKAYLCC